MRAGALLAAALVLSASSSAGAAPEDVANRLSYEIMSPFCPGVTLHDCPSDEATELRNQIARWASSGWSRDRIMARLRSEFGPQILAVPPADEGAGLVAWLAPVLLAVVAAVLVPALSRRWSTRRSREEGPEPSAEDRRRVAAELDRFRRDIGAGAP